MRKILKAQKVGKIRNKKVFLFIPKEINNELRWLEFATYSQTYVAGDYADAADGTGDHWRNTNWVNK
jgi:hypothetical protein